MRPLTWLIRLAAIVLAGALVVSASVIAIGPRLWRIANAHEELPVELPDFLPLAQRTLVYDAAGNVIAVYSRENSQPTSIDRVPQSVVDAVLAVEDELFFEHDGVNVRSLVRATLSNVQSGASRQGASTITQQVVKNEFLAGLERDSRYKLLQVHYALMLDRAMDKRAILERYLNTVFFGNNAYGIQAAAEVYFGKSVEQLDLLEGAFLAGLIRSPSGYDPIRRPERSRARFRQVLDRLVDVGLVDDEQSVVLGDEWPIPERVRELPSFDTDPTYFTTALRDYLLERSDILGDSEQTRATQLYRGGLRIHTTLDPRLQSLAETARDELPANRAGIDAALVSLDSRTGAIRAMVGGRGFEPRTNEINMALVPRQTGSSIKMFILAAAVQAGAQADDTIDGRRGCILPNPGDPSQPFAITGGVAGFLGRLDAATWASLNCAYARLTQIVGLNRMVDSVYRMAGSSYLYRGQPRSERLPIEPYASFATGANELSPLDMAAGAQTLANGGVHHEPYYVDWIDRVDGARLYTHVPVGEQVVDRETALVTTDVLKGVLTRGTARRELSDFPFPAAGKTGTQQDNTNSWFVGYTPELSTAVWVGDPDGYTPMIRENVPEFYELDAVEAVQGGTYPARIWGAFQEPALAFAQPSDWDAPGPARRVGARLVLPGEECVFEVLSGEVGPDGVPMTTVAAPSTTVAPVTPTTGAPAAGDDAVAPAPDGDASAVETTVVSTTTTVAPVVVRPLPDLTTIAPEVLDPRAPMPSVPAATPVVACDRLPEGVVVLGPDEEWP